MRAYIEDGKAFFVICEEIPSFPRETLKDCAPKLTIFCTFIPKIKNSCLFKEQRVHDCALFAPRKFDVIKTTINPRSKIRGLIC